MLLLFFLRAHPNYKLLRTFFFSFAPYPWKLQARSGTQPEYCVLTMNHLVATYSLAKSQRKRVNAIKINIQRISFISPLYCETRGASTWNYGLATFVTLCTMACFLAPCSAKKKRTSQVTQSQSACRGAAWNWWRNEDGTEEKSRQEENSYECNRRLRHSGKG